MGKLIDGIWTDAPFPVDPTGRFRRAPTTFRERVEPDVGARFAAESGRYHLYVSLACPWAHRVLIVRALRGLEEVFSLSIVDPYMGDDGWFFSDGPGCIPDHVNRAATLREIYLASDPHFTGRVTVPVLWDRTHRTIVNNESREIIRLFDRAFAAFGRPLTLCPPELETAIDAEIDAMFETVNNAVYRAGFAGTQEAHEEAVRELFATLEAYEKRLSGQRFLLGDVLTEADICLFTTLFRFDAVYVTHFKCNIKRLVDLPNLWDYARAIYQLDGVRETCNLEHCKGHYYRSHESLNPRRIVPLGPEIDFEQPHRRGQIRLASNRIEN
ncbi:MAG: glutathione S-transferase family protein [Myxococcales bacterium]|nr:glutathione S-transferase family protein [Myxococcales bacterium]